MAWGVELVNRANPWIARGKIPVLRNDSARPISQRLPIRELGHDRKLAGLTGQAL